MIDILGPFRFSSRRSMRFLLSLAVVANLALLAYGQGFFGPPPAEQGRDPRPLSQRNQQSLVLGTPVPPEITQQ
ncbi:MAG TPA: hypothetical protein VF285_03845 [Castellaniella sp.]|uniref:hypothetical protein n=1 Tax=Castellaniella sp. TaxID=1955812 RepID=UPI002EF160A9